MGRITAGATGHQPDALVGPGRKKRYHLGRKGLGIFDIAADLRRCFHDVFQHGKGIAIHSTSVLSASIFSAFLDCYGFLAYTLWVVRVVFPGEAAQTGKHL